MRPLVASLKITAYLIANIAIVPVHTLMYFINKGPWLYVLPRIYHKICCAIFGIRVTTVGTPVTDKQTLFMSNHLSYLDIPALSTVLPRIHFVAKKDVEGWPVWGFLAKLQQTAFISRSRSDAKKETQSLTDIVSSGKNLAIFAEGTSTNGAGIEPFKSSLFSIAQGPAAPQDLVVQPVTLKMTSLDGAPHSGADTENLYTWPRELEMDLIPHLWRFAKSKGVGIEVVFHAPLHPAEFSDRKTLAKACYEAVCNGLKD